MRTSTKVRIIKKVEILVSEWRKGVIEKERLESVVHSYLGVLSHCKGYKIACKIREITGIDNITPPML
jgi:hypothetical protein